MYDIITYCSVGYEKILLKFLSSWLRNEVIQIHIYCDHDNDFPQLDKRVELYEIFGNCIDAGVGCARKTEAVNVHKYRMTRPTVLLDVDCFINQDLSSVFDGTFDIGVAVNPRSKPRTRINSVSGGLLFINNTNSAKGFVERWVEKQRLIDGPSRDQASLVKTVLGCAKAIVASKCRIKEFSEDIYNCHPYTNTPHHLQYWKDRARNPMDLDQTCERCHFRGICSGANTEIGEGKTPF